MPNNLQAPVLRVLAAAWELTEHALPALGPGRPLTLVPTSIQWKLSRACGWVADSSPELPSQPQLIPAHEAHLLAELGSEEGIILARRHGVRSLTREEAIALGYGVWQGKEKPRTGCSGLLFPFGGQFGQVRLDEPELLMDAKGKPVGKYRNRAGVKAEAAIIGTEDQPAATIGTEGWKDGAALHLASGETVAAIAGVAQWKLLPESLKCLYYDADAILNPGVFGPLIEAGLDRPHMRIGFFPADIAGPHGGACEFLRNGGRLKDIQLYSAIELIRALPQFWTKDRLHKGRVIPGNIRPEWRARTVWRLGHLAYQAGMGLDGTEQIIRIAAKAVGVDCQRARKMIGTLWRTMTGDAAVEAGRISAKELQDFLLERHQLEFDTLSKRFMLDSSPIRPEDSANFNQWLADRYRLDVNQQIATGALQYLAMKMPYNPVERYLRDIRERVDLHPVLPEEIGRAFGLATGDTLSIDMLLRHLVGALKRGILPGFKHDQMLVLAGGQGWKKTEAITALAPLPDWVDGETEIKDYAAWPFLLRINGCWHFALDECEQTLRSRSAAETKGMITRRHDRYALKFQNDVTSWPRPGVLWGTTNSSVFLSDHTGARRFWVCPLVQPCDPKWIADNRDRLWFTIWLLAEAGLRNFYDGESPRAEEAQARATDVSTDDSWGGLVATYLSNQPSSGNGVSTDRILAGLPPEIRDTSNKGRGRLSRIIEAQGFTTHGGTIRWVRHRYRYDGASNPIWGYAPRPMETQGSTSPPESVDYSWAGEPVTVCPSARRTPQGWPTLEPWYEVFTLYLAQRDERCIPLTEDAWRMFCEQVLRQPQNHWDAGEPPTGLQSTMPAVAADSLLQQSEDCLLRHRDALPFRHRSTWVDPAEPVGPNGRQRYLRVVSQDINAVIELQPLEALEGGGGSSCGPRLMLTATLQQRLQPREAC